MTPDSAMHPRCWLLLLTLLTSCRDGSTEPGALRRTTYEDPALDPLDCASSIPPVPDLFPDVRRLDAVMGRDTLVVTVTFADSVAPLAARTPRSVRVFLGFDADRNADTGAQYTFTRGLDYGLNTFASTGDALLFHWLGPEEVTLVPVTYSATTITIHVPLDLMPPAARGVRLVGEAARYGFDGNGCMMDIFPAMGGAIDVPAPRR